MRTEAMKARLESLRRKVINVEEALENPYKSQFLENELRELESEIELFSHFLEERFY